ncbi:MAG: 2-oxo acid dehydrogenase subunit E2 [Microbacterium arborescens]
MNIGIAVASPTGLVVPVVGDADQKTASQIATEARRLAGLAQDRRLGAAEMTGGTFTISNLGMFGVEEFTAIINPPEGAILAVGAARAEPVVIDGAVEVRHRMRYTLSADHRIIDGALAARFLATLTGLLEDPLSIIA